MNKALKIIGVAFGVCAILALLGFVGSIRSSALCEEVQILNHTDYDVQLVSKETVLAAIELVEKPVEGRPMNLIDTRSIEKGVMSLPYVKSATAYKTIDKKIVVEIEERTIIARLIDENGISAFLDSDGYVLPKLGSVSLRLPVVSGEFKLSKEKLAYGYNSKGIELLEAIYRYASLIVGSAFWKAQLQRTHVDREGNFTAIPQVGNHDIEFGTIENIENKLIKLATFYEQGMNEARWNLYRTINLKYEDQVVCTKN